MVTKRERYLSLLPATVKKKKKKENELKIPDVLFGVFYTIDQHSSK